MPLMDIIGSWWTRARRRRLIRREMDDLSRISPQLYSDIGLYPQAFRDQAERSVDCRLRSRRNRRGAGTDCPTGTAATCTDAAC